MLPLDNDDVGDATPEQRRVVVAALSAADAPQIELLPRTVYATRRLAPATTATSASASAAAAAEVGGEGSVLVCALASPADRLAL